MEEVRSGNAISESEAKRSISALVEQFANSGFSSPKDFFQLTKEQIVRLSKRRIERQINDENRFLMKLLMVITAGTSAGFGNGKEMYEEVLADLKKPFRLEDDYFDENYSEDEYSAENLNLENILGKNFRKVQENDRTTGKSTDGGSTAGGNSSGTEERVSINDKGIDRIKGQAGDNRPKKRVIRRKRKGIETS